jgi:hypothetical protein
MRAPPEIARIEEGIGFQRRVWRAERIGWALMLALVLAALGGLFGGGGPLARGQARDGGLEADWPRMARLGAGAPIRVTLPPEPGAREAELRLPADFAARWRVREIAPAPLEAEAGAAAFVLRLRRDPDGHAAVSIEAEPEGGPGPRRLRLEASGRVLDLPVFVWP